MKLKITFRHLESTPAIEAKIKDKAAHLEKYFDREIDVKWMCEVDGNRQTSEVFVHYGKQHYFASSEDSNLYKTFDQVVNKIESQIRKNAKTLHSKHSEILSFPQDEL